MSNKVYYAYNVYVGKFWNGHWFCAKRKDAVPLDSRFWDAQYGSLPEQQRNIHLVRPDVKPSKRR